MESKAKIGMNEAKRDELTREATAVLAEHLRNLYRLHDGDRAALERTIDGIDAARGEENEEPIVIKVETFGAFYLLTLREYVEEFIRDWEIGLDDARAILSEDPEPLVYNEDCALTDPEFLQLHFALDTCLLEAEVVRLAAEEQ